MKKSIRVGTTTLLMLLVVAGLAVATGTQQSADTAERFKLSFMTTSYLGEPMTEESPVYQAMVDYTGYDVELMYVPSTVYEDRFNIVLASGDLPNVMLASSKTSSVISAARSGAFWEVGPYFSQFHNLSQSNPVVNNNISIDGKVYGVYRARQLGRNAIVYRKDWARAVGIEVPKTLDDLYQMMYRMTHNDPDGNGKDDTYAQVVSSYNGPWKVMLPWFGLPNEWGPDTTGKLMPAHMFPEYKDALNYWRNMYKDGLINQDFAVYDPGKWTDPIIAGQAGMMIDVADNAGRWEDKFKTAGMPAEINVIGGVSGPDGYRLLPFRAGYNGFFIFPKSNTPNEADLLKVLDFMDKLGDRQMQDLLSYGIEGRHYVLTDTGEIDPTILADHEELKPEVQDANQLLYFFPNVGTPRVMTEVRKLQDRVQKENEEFVVGNPAAPFVSTVYAQKGAQLDQIIEDARVQYIVGRINMDGFDAAVTRWRQNGGDEYIAEINQLYNAAK